MTSVLELLDLCEECEFKTISASAATAIATEITTALTGGGAHHGGAVPPAHAPERCPVCGMGVRNGAATFHSQLYGKERERSAITLGGSHD